MNYIYTCCIVDDEKYGRDLLLSHIENIPDLECIAVESDAEQALTKITSGKIKADLFFLDITMPHVDGLQFGGVIKARKLGEIIYVSGYETFGVRSYEIEPIDYILKPATLERLNAGFAKFKARMEGRSGNIVRVSSLFFVFEDKNGKITRIEKEDLILVEASDDELIFHLSKGRQVIPYRLKDFEEEMGDFPFVKCQRSFIVNVTKVIGITHSHVTVPLDYMKEVSLGRNFKKQFRERVMLYLGLKSGKK